MIEPLLDDGDPYLAFHRVPGRAEKRLDAKLLFDPFEAQFCLPAVTIEIGNRLRRCGEVVGQKVECLASAVVVILDTT